MAATPAVKGRREPYSKRVKPSHKGAFKRLSLGVSVDLGPEEPRGEAVLLPHRRAPARAQRRCRALPHVCRAQPPENYAASEAVASEGAGERSSYLRVAPRCRTQRQRYRCGERLGGTERVVLSSRRMRGSTMGSDNRSRSNRACGLRERLCYEGLAAERRRRGELDFYRGELDFYRPKDHTHPWNTPLFSLSLSLSLASSLSRARRRRKRVSPWRRRRCWTAQQVNVRS